ncbi:MAG: hypothetical protein JO007_10330 [Alphaproteobacteria bacterium]|nr:hypothetical protein [Alphaproteobacteria bacterium]
MVDNKYFYALLPGWWGSFRERWVAAEEIIDLANEDREKMLRMKEVIANEDGEKMLRMKHGFYDWIALRVGLEGFGIKSHDELDRLLDEVKNDVLYGFMIKRDESCMQPVKWRLIKQEIECEMTDEERNQWLAARKEAGLKIDPATAEVDWSYEQTLDPYGIYPDLPEECRQTGREYFARAPGTDIWVWFGDLPDATLDALWERGREKASGK